jgi:hypothetical protein
MTARRPTISGVPFLELFHHDGRFIRAPGLFAFARRLGPGRYEILHFELAEAINRTATPGHPRWVWALQARMDTLLVHVFAARHSLSTDGVEACWHAEAQVVFEGALGLVGEGAPRPSEPQVAGLAGPPSRRPGCALRP